MSLSTAAVTRRAGVCRLSTRKGYRVRRHDEGDTLFFFLKKKGNTKAYALRRSESVSEYMIKIPVFFDMTP